jgi:hypothetical protein
MSPHDPRPAPAFPDLGDLPPEEGVSAADAAERVDRDPEREPNATDPRAIAAQTHPEDS